MVRKGKKKANLDPLFQLFEHYLLTRSYDDSAKFTKALADAYLTYLDSTPAHVPFDVRPLVIENLEAEVKEMLLKKMYGCVHPDDYRNMGLVMGSREVAASFPFNEANDDSSDFDENNEKD